MKRAPHDPATDPAAGRRPRWRRGPGLPIAAAAAVIAVSVIGVLAQAGGRAGTLDPDGTSAQSSRALAVLLRNRGVAVDRVPTVAAALGSAGSGTTIFVPLPERVPAGDLAALAGSAGPVVLVDPPAPVLQRLLPGLGIADGVAERERLPGCDLAAAVVAGGVDLGGRTYVARGPDPAVSYQGCYLAGGRPCLVAGQGPVRSVTVVGTGRPFRNDALGEHGNAALALGLLGGGDRVRWLLPRPAEAAGAGRQGLLDLLPGRLLLAMMQVAVAVAVLALWRGRRLGPVVAEELPVAVRAAETTEGRGRLYRATSARAAAAAALRAGARTRLAARAGLDPQIASAALVGAVSRRTARDAGEVAALLYGAPGLGESAAPDPPDDTSLVRLAAELDDLDPPEPGRPLDPEVPRP